MFSITNFMFLLIKILPMLLLGLALFISLILKYFPDFLRVQSGSKFIITSLNKIAFFTVAVILTGNLWHVFYLIKPRTFKIERITIFTFSFCIGLVTQLNGPDLGVLKHHNITKRIRELLIGNSRFLIYNLLNQLLCYTV